MKRRELLLAATLGTLTRALPAQTTDWPSRPIRVIYPFPPGGAIEAMIRAVTTRMSRELGQQLIVENRTGAGGTIGSALGAKAAPDGYNLVISGLPTHVIEPVYSGTPYDPMRDFTHIGLLGGTPVVLAVHPDLGPKTVQEFIALARSRPDGISYASAGSGTSVHLFGERFRQLTGSKLVHVPYKGLIPAALDLIAGHIPAAFTTVGQAREFYLQGKIRILAVATPTRMALHPELPTFVEAGYKDLVSSAWFAISGPAGMPKPIVTRLNAQIRAALAQPEIFNKLQADGIGIEPRDLDADGFTDYFRAEIERWTPVVRSVKSSEVK